MSFDHEVINDTSNRYPRTLQEAFGPYTSSQLHSIPDNPKESLSRALQDLAICIIGVAAIIIIVLVAT